jgi:hypothetical protein
MLLGDGGKNRPWQSLKAAVADAPLLHPSDPCKPFYVVTDASDYGCGASLEQMNSRDERCPIAFFSHQLNPAETRYPVHERELLAIVLALRTWRHYLYGSDFKVVCQTDHGLYSTSWGSQHCPLDKCAATVPE